MSITKPRHSAISTDEIGEQFLDYFSRLGYETIPGSSLLDESVPMSFVMSAGMVQFERLSSGKRSGDHFVLIQNCFRYFDLEQIGTSRIHLSLFRMPGAFEFGPVNQRRTIANIWRLLVQGYGFDQDDLIVTYFGGDTIDGQVLPADVETAAAWRAVGIPEERILGLPAKNNFWVQSSLAVGSRNSRKRGPNTEVFFDRGVEYACGVACAPGCSCGRYIEFLNILFITLGVDGTTHQLIPLEEPFTEVVIGEERVAFLLQGRESIYEIDSILPLIQQVRAFSKPLPVEVRSLDTHKFEQVLVDHLRALLFLIADGAPPPGRGGRSRLMRILVRELLTSQRMLGISDLGFLRSMFLTAVKIYPGFEYMYGLLREYISHENELFERTLQVGLYDLELVLQQREGQISGADILTLEKKHGLPIALLAYRLWQRNISFPEEEYSSARKHIDLYMHGSVLKDITTPPIEAFAEIGSIIKISLENYQASDYQVLPGGSLIDESIPMSFVMSAGFAQVERGLARMPTRTNDRVVIIQNCFRHFDLDKIGPSNTHLSFFRMLGAFAFGQSEKSSQIRNAWNLACNIYKMPPERLWVTYFDGDTLHGHVFEPDTETRDIWREIGVPFEHILGLDGNTNFWNQNAATVDLGNDLKCGPTSEIFFDRGAQFGCGPDCGPGCGCGRFIEFLNMLFISWYTDRSTGLVGKLENPFIETVIGIERLTMIVQNAPSIFEIDNVRPLLAEIDQVPKDSELNEQEYIQYRRILVDHIRALLFLVADGAPAPGKGGRAFLMRRLVRETIMSMELLGIYDPAFLPACIENAIGLHPENRKCFQEIKPILLDYINVEKAKFECTLEHGFKRVTDALAHQNVQWVSGMDVLHFEKEFGLPLPMLARFLINRKIAFNPKAYEAARELWEWETVESHS